MKGFIRPRRIHCDAGHVITGTGRTRRCTICANARKRRRWATMTRRQRAWRNTRARAAYRRTRAKV